MENVVTNNNGTVNVDPSFFSKNTSASLRAATAAASLGYPVSTTTNETGVETMVGVMCPKTPVFVTFGATDMNSLQERGIYHNLGLDELVISEDSKGLSNKAACEYLYNVFQNTANLGKGNDAVNTIISKSYSKIGEIAKVTYSAHYPDFEEFCREYVEYLDKQYGSSNEAEKKMTVAEGPTIRTETLN